MDLSYFLKVLFRRKWYILLLTLIAVAAAFVFLLFKKNLYESIAQYSTGFTAEKVRLVDGSAAMDVYSADIKFQNVIETFKSPKVIGMLSYHLLLHDLENPQKAYRTLKPEEKNSREFRVVNIDTAKRILRHKLINLELLASSDTTEKNLIEYLKLYNYDYNSIRNYLIPNRVERTDYLNIVFRSENPELSADVVNTIGQKFINYYSHLTDQRTEESAETIKALVSIQQRKVDSIGQTLLRAKVAQGSIDPVQKSTSAMETVKELESQMATEKSNLYTREQRLKYLIARRNTLLTTGSTSSGNDEVLLLMNRRRTLMSENAKKGGNDPDLTKQINDLTTEIVLKSGNTSSAAKSKDELDEVNNEISQEEGSLAASKLTVADYQSKINQYLNISNTDPGSNVEMEMIQSQLNIENKALENIKEKLNQAEGLLKDNPAVNIKQTLVGQPAVEPEPNKRLMTMGLAGISMFFLSSLMFLFIAIFDSSIKSPSQFEKLTEMKLASVVNDIKWKHRTPADVILNEEGRLRDDKLFKQHLRKLRFEIDNSGQKVFLFTSTKRGEGKSTLIEALAASMLLSKKRVLLVDTNFSNNQLSQRFEAKAALESDGMVVGSFSSSQLENLVSKTNYPNLDIIGCKGGSYTPSEVFSTDKNILAHLRNLSDYDYVFMEGAAMNDFADTRELLQYADRVVAVFSAESTIRQMDNESIEYLKQLDGKLQGAVLNKVQTENLDA